MAEELTSFYLNKCVNCGCDRYLEEDNENYICVKCVPISLCMKCEKRFSVGVSGGYFVCRTCSRSVPGVAEAVYLDGNLTYKTCVHCGCGTDRNCSGRFFECDDCHDHEASKRAMNQKLDCRKLGMTVGMTRVGKGGQMTGGRWGRGNLTFYLPHLDLSLRLTYGQMESLLKCLAGQVCDNESARVICDAYKVPHHYARYDFSEVYCEIECQYYFKSSYSIFFIVREGCLELVLDGAQFSSLRSICELLV